MRLIDADVVKEALRNRISENIDECINNVPTVCDIEQIRAAITFQRYTLERGEEVLYRGGYNDGIDTALDIIDHYTK